MHGVVWEFMFQNMLCGTSAQRPSRSWQTTDILHICLNLHGPVLGDEEGFSYLIAIKCGLILTV